VAQLTRYYAESGTPPGIFLGSGLASLGGGRDIEKGETVSEDQLWRILAVMANPLAGHPVVNRLRLRRLGDSQSSASHPNRSPQPDRLECANCDQIVDTPFGTSEDGGNFFDTANVGVVSETKAPWVISPGPLLRAD